MDTKDGIIKKQESELAQLIEIRMRTFIEDDKNSKAIDWINLGSKRIAQEWFAYRSRLEPDKKSADFTDEDMNHAITGE